MLFRTVTRACGGIVLMGLIALSCGCSGPNYKARATVKGKVTYEGKSLTCGSVVFYLDKHNITGSATIDKNGNYVMPDAPIGDVTVTVSVPPLPMGGPAGGTNPFAGVGGAAKGTKSVDPNNPGRSINMMGEIPDKIIPIPQKYSRTDSSGLTYKVEKGDHTFDIILK